MRAQKKILGRMAKKNVAKIFIDDTSANLLDNVHRLAKMNSNNKKEADKVCKNMIKVVIKIGILHRNDQFNEKELDLADSFKQQFRSLAMTLVSFHEVEYSYDRNFLMQSINKCKDQLNDLIGKHLTEKSHQRINYLFDFFANPVILDHFYRSSDADIKDLRSNIISDVNKLLEEGAL